MVLVPCWHPVVHTGNFCLHLISLTGAYLGKQTSETNQIIHPRSVLQKMSMPWWHLKWWVVCATTYNTRLFNSKTSLMSFYQSFSCTGQWQIWIVWEVSGYQSYCNLSEPNAMYCPSSWEPISRRIVESWVLNNSRTPSWQLASFYGCLSGIQCQGQSVQRLANPLSVIAWQKDVWNVIWHSSETTS